jgi:MMP 1-O-methyltransferase
MKLGALLGRQPLPEIPSIPAYLRELALRTKGFLSAAEGDRLYHLAAESARRAPCLEVGSFCGRSTLFLGAGCQASGGHPLFAVDHHRGSVEQQPGQEYFDPELLDPVLGQISTVSPLTRAIRQAGLEDWVIPVVTDSTRASRNLPALRLSLVFIDGGHATEDVDEDFRAWAPRLISGGYLCVHDLYFDPQDGGQAPRERFEKTRAERGWEQVGLVGSLGVLRRC